MTSELRYIPSGYTCWESCRYCGARLTVVNKPMRVCLDCPGRFCVKEQCFENFKAGTQAPYMVIMDNRVFSCSPHHTFYATPACPYSLRKSIPSGHVVVGSSTKDDLKFMPLGEWKMALRKSIWRVMCSQESREQYLE